LSLQAQDQFAQLGQHAQHPRIERGKFLPVARTHQRAAVGHDNTRRPGCVHDWPDCEWPRPGNFRAAGAFALALLGLAGDANGREFVAVAIQPAGQAQAQGAGIELVGLALAVQGDGRDEKTLGAGGHEFAVETKPKPQLSCTQKTWKPSATHFLTWATSGSRVNLRGRADWRGLSGHGHDEFEVDVQAELEQGFAGVNDGGGQRLARRNDLDGCWLVKGRAQRYGLGCHDGFEKMYSS